MNDFFQEHKRFLVIHVAGALIFLILWLIIGGMFDDDIAGNRRREQRSRAVAARSLPAGVDIETLQRTKQDQDEVRDALVGKVRRAVPKRYTLGGVADPDQHYTNVVSRARTEMSEEFALRNIILDEGLGLPDRFPSSRSEFVWYLRGLDVVDQVLRLVLKADQDILPEGISRFDGIEILPMPKQRTIRTTNAYVNHHEVSFRLVGHPTSLAYLLEEVSRSRPGEGLVLRSCRLRSLDQPPGLVRRGRQADPLDQGRVEANLVLAAVDIDDSGNVRAKGLIK
jgi:hypothetical protein